MGDGCNDLEMLEWAAHGVAMGGSAEPVQAAADAVTDDVFHDGAAVVLQALLTADAERETSTPPRNVKSRPRRQVVREAPTLP